MKQTQQLYKTGTWFFIFLMFVQTTFAYENLLATMSQDDNRSMRKYENESGEQSANKIISHSSLTIDDSALTNNEGIIGLYGEKQIDNPADNYFDLWLEEEPNDGERVYLVYELEGVANYHSVARSINDELSIGGHWVQLSDAKSTQRELLNPQSLRKGKNKLHFSVLENADYGYKISNLRFEVANKSTLQPINHSAFTINNSSQLHYTALWQGDRLYLKGFVNQEVTKLEVAGQEIKLHNGNFELELPLTEAQAFTLIKKDGSRQIEKIESKELAWLDYRHEIEEFGVTKSAFFQKENDNELQLESIELLAEKAQTLEDRELSVTSLRAIDLPALDMGMSNLTKTHKAYRFLPHGEHFADSGAVVKIAYDKLNLPSGYTEKQINAYFFDEATGHWSALKKDSVDTKNGIIYARTTHFTDMIAGVIKAPESPETAGFTPTMMTGIKAADPTTKVGLIAPPQANQRGSAGMQYPFEMPPARNGMTPSVALSYNSDGGSGWLGEGWDISTPSISVETRWGVPRYNTEKETETYLMDGQMLGFIDGDELHLSHRHKEKKDRSGDRQFYPRKEGSFSKIIRKGDSPSNYTWEVTDKNGTVYTYGGNGGVLKGTITDINGKQREVISEWKLSKITEKHGDYIDYFYETKQEEVRGSLTAKALYLTKIENNSGTTVLFDSQNKKTKKNNNARYGFLASNHQLLDKISIQFEGTTLRYYTFNYKDGAFHSNLLGKVTQYDSKNEEFASHQFDYYDDVNKDGDTKLFADSEGWNLQDDNIRASFVNSFANLGIPGFSEKASALGGQTSETYSFSNYMGVGIFGDVTTTGMTAGASFGYSRGKSEGISTLIDINGDGLLDKVFMGGFMNTIPYYRAQKVDTDGKVSYGDAIVLSGINKISRSTSNTTEGGTKVKLGVYSVVSTSGTDWSKTTSKQKVYFTDVNSDGLPDLVDEGRVYFNHIVEDDNGNLVPVFEESSELSAAPIRGGGNIDITQFEPTAEEQAEAIEYSPMQDVVRVWEAPFDGEIGVSGFVHLLQPQESNNEEGYDKADGVRIAIQKGGAELWHRQISRDDANQHPASLDKLEIKQGDRLYFRVQSGNKKMSNGTYDKVLWNPEITYLGDNYESPHGHSNTYKPSEAQIMSTDVAAYLNEAVDFSVSGTFKKPETSDEVSLQIYLSNNMKTNDGSANNPNYFRELVWEQSFADNVAYDGELRLSIPNPKAGQNIEFKVVSSSNVQWTNVQWKPTLSYEMNGASMSVVPHVHYSIYAAHFFQGEAYTIVKKDTVCAVIPKLYINPKNKKSGELLMVVKTKDRMLARDTIRFQDTHITRNTAIDTLFTDSEKVWAEYYGELEVLACLDSVKTEFINLKQVKKLMPSDAYGKRSEEGFGHMYRGWGQFVYNASGDRYAKPIDERLLKLPTSDGVEMNPLTTAFVQMMADDATKSYYTGQNPTTQLRGDTLVASRLGDQEVKLTNPFDGIDLNSGGFLGVGVSQNSQSKSHATMVGLGFQTQSFAKGESNSTLSFQDMNGDGFPDILGTNTIDYTNTLGGFDGELIRNVRNHSTSNNSESIALGGLPIHSNSPTTSPTAAASKSQEKKISVEIAKNSSGDNNTTGSVSIPMNYDQTQATFLDVNGDGLADQILDDKSVKLNLGYSFSEAVDWDFKQIEKGNSLTVSAGLGFDIGSSSLAGGFGITTTSSHRDYTIADVNADGLPDKLQQYNDAVYVSLNTGNGFAQAQKWTDGEIGKSTSTSESFNASYTVPINIAFFGLKIIPLNPSVSTAQSMSRSLTALRDVDGDGYPDYVSSDEDKKMTVKRSTIARTNKLKAVQNPLGGSFAIDYKRSAATYNHPGGKWVLASLEINDGVADDGANSLTHFDYADGKHDRYEREFLGFGKVMTKQLDTEKENALYRSVEQTYDVSNYHTSGNNLSSTLKDAQDKVYTHSSQEYYTYKVSPNGDKYGFAEAGAIDKLSSPMVFTPLKFSQNQNHEGGTGKAILQQAHYSYRSGATGELSSYKFSDNGNLSADGNGSFNYQTSISYTDNTSKRILGLPSGVQVTGGDGKLYRETTASYDDLGRITQVSQTLDKGKATSNFEWDKYGNITKRTMPENSKGQRMWYSYQYERDYNMYPTRIEDAWGYRSELEDYDYRYGIPLRTKDMNGYYQEQQIDHMGRLTEIIAPNELAEGAPYTIRFSYHKAQMNNGKLENPAYALTSHYDPEHPENPMNTTTFVDGMGRAIQVKKDGVIANNASKQEVSIVSGRAYFDAFGRAQKAYYPTTADLNEYKKFSTDFDNISPTITTFDLMDRATQITMPDGTKTSNAYRVDGNLQVIKSTDAEGGQQASYTNGSGLNIKTEQLSGPDGTITTSFKYDAINQLLQAIDTEGNAIVSVYDMGGRRTSVTHPDAGTSTFTYDNLGNVLTRQTANLADSSVMITYEYDYHRLTAVNYPLNPENNVKYHYGTKHANHNRVGRLALQEDATGAQEFFYGHMGELTKLRRTHIIPNHAVATFEMQWKYDSWNRVQEMIYPDKEKLSYHYDAGGQLKGLTGNKAYSYNYVQDIGYDKFGQRTYIKYCNGTETTYNYDPLMRRLEGLQAKNQSRMFMDNAYSFDKVGNILKVGNSANAGVAMGGQMSHTYEYDGLYRLSQASGMFAGSDKKAAIYSLEMSYDNMHNITGKKQHIAQTDVAFAGELMAGYELNYKYSKDKPHQLESIKDNNYRTADSKAVASKTKQLQDAYTYDSNGNLIFVNTADSVQTNIKERQLSWDEENRLRAIADNGYVSSYFYDAAGERTIKLHGGGEGIHVNSAFSSGYTNNVDYTLYVDAYMVLEKGGQYTKHIYIGNQRIVSKLGDVGSFGVDPRREEYAGANVAGVTAPNYKTKYEALQNVIKDNYAKFEVDYYGIDNDDYVNGEGFCCEPKANTRKGRSLPTENVDYERLQYYYHSDHLGSASYITNLDGEVVQHIEYVPFGEVFLEERNNTWNTPFLFNGKELDEETGLYYYGARYYNPRISLWYGVDPLNEERYGLSPYQYCQNSPVMLTDPTGMLDDNYSVDDKGNVKLEEKTNDDFDRLYTKESWDDGTKSKFVKVNDKEILPQLESKENVAKYEPKPTDMDQEILYGSVANTSNSQDAYKLFKFLAKNSNVEWSFQKYTDNTSSITTSNKNSTTLTGRFIEANKNKLVATDIHSHPNTYPDDLKPSSVDNSNMRVYLRENPNAKVQLYIPQVKNPNGRMLDMVNNKWILHGKY